MTVSSEIKSSARRAAPRRVFLKNYGCQMNVYDGARMLESLTPLGYQRTEDAESADLVILMSCHIRAKAAEKIYSDLGRIRQKKKEGSLVALAGCVAQAEGAESLRRAPVLDIVLGPQSLHKLPQILRRRERGGIAETSIETALAADAKFRSLPPRGRASVSAFLTVQEGCDRFCSFCVVPYTRGAEFSRPVMDIIKEAETLALKGAKEIILLGQNVNAYRGRGFKRGEGLWSLARLIKRLAQIPEIRRIRYTTSHPSDMKEDLIRAHAEEEKLMPFLHLPAQSGSERILKAMNRRHDAEFYWRIVKRLREARPDIALSSDFIVGFPGETEEDFQKTLALAERVSFAQAYSFKYSPRPGTPAASLDNQIPEETKQERLTRLRLLLDAQQRRFNESFVGRHLPVLLTDTGGGRGGREGQIAAKSPYGQSVYLEKEGDPRHLAPGRVSDALITEGYAHALRGRAA